MPRSGHLVTGSSRGVVGISGRFLGMNWGCVWGLLRRGARSAARPWCTTWVSSREPGLGGRPRPPGRAPSVKPTCCDETRVQDMGLVTGTRSRRRSGRPPAPHQRNPRPATRPTARTPVSSREPGLAGMPAPRQDRTPQKPMSRDETHGQDTGLAAGNGSRPDAGPRQDQTPRNPRPVTRPTARTRASSPKVGLAAGTGRTTVHPALPQRSSPPPILSAVARTRLRNAQIIVRKPQSRGTVRSDTPR